MQNKDGERGGIRRLSLVKSVRKNVVRLVWYPNIYNRLIFTNHVHIYLCAHVPSLGNYFFLSTSWGLPPLRETMHGLSCFFFSVWSRLSFSILLITLLVVLHSNFRASQLTNQFSGRQKRKKVFLLIKWNNFGKISA